MSVTIRRAVAADVPALAALMQGFYAESGLSLGRRRAESAFAALLSDARLGAVWVAEAGEAVVGYVALTLGFSMEYGALRGSVDDLYVIPEARGQSLATSLLSEVRKFAVKRDIRALGVEIGPEDDRARRLYAGAGYAESDHRSMILSLAAPLHETEP